jgi:hypothetical protein
VAEGRKLACNMKMMFAMLESAQEKNRGKEKKSKPVLAAKPAGTMDMASMNMGSM